MTAFNIGDSVVVAGLGPGVVSEIVGGPAGNLYRVSLTDDQVGYGLTSNYVAMPSELIPAADLPSYAPGDIVLYQRRTATVVAYDPSNGSVEIETDVQLPDANSEVYAPSRVVLPRWKVYLQQLKG